MKKNSQKCQKTIGVVISGSFSQYDPLICLGIRDAAKLSNTRLCFIPVVLISSHQVDSYQNIPVAPQLIKSLLAGIPLDGVIFLAEELSSFFTPEEYQKIKSCFNRTPHVNIGLDGSQAHHVNAAHYTGMQMLMDYLIKSCCYRHIAFVRGPRDNHSADERFRAYVDSLAKFSIQLDQRWIFQGNFRISSGKKAVKTLIDDRQMMPDVIVCANDDMAIGVHQALQKRGIQIPTEIAVTGIDNSPIATISSPALTTVQQPLYEMGQAAVELLIGLIDDDVPVAKKTLPSQLVIRGSTNAPFSPLSRSPHSVTSASITTQLMVTLPTLLSQTQKKELSEKFLAAKNLADAAHFNHYFLECLAEAIFPTADRWRGWQEAFKQWGRLTQEQQWEQVSQIRSHMLAQAHSNLADHMIQQQVNNRQKGETIAISERELLANPTFDNLISMLNFSIGSYGINGCRLALFQTAPAISNDLRLLFNHVEDIDKPESSLKLDAFHRGAFESTSIEHWMVIYLTFGQEYFGVLMLSMAAYDHERFETLRTQLVTALKLMFSLQHLRDEADALEQQVQNRTAYLQLLLREKEELLNIVSHDLQNPLSAMILNLDLLELAIDEGNQKQSKKIIERSQNGTIQMLELIKQFLTYQSQSTQSFEPSFSNMSVSAFLSSAAERIGVQATMKSISIDIEQAGDPIFVQADPVLANQILDNLLSNAVKFSFPNQRITLKTAVKDEKTAVIKIVDHGQGLSADDLDKIFQKFQRLSTIPTAGEASVGLGLYISRNMMNAMGGDIVAESSGKGQGSTFSLIFPRAQGAPASPAT